MFAYIKGAFTHLNAYLHARVGAYMIVAGVFGSLLVGTSNDDLITDPKTNQDHIYLHGGNDLVIYTPSETNKDYIDGGQGIDTLWLRLTPKEYENPELKTDIIRFYYFVFNNLAPRLDTGEGPDFKFKSFDLSTRNVEHIIIEKIKGKVNNKAIAKPSLQIKPLDKDLSGDNRV